jgi:putative transposase
MEIYAGIARFWGSTQDAGLVRSGYLTDALDRVLILGERHLHAVLIEYQAHYNMARPHQGIGQSVPSDERDAPRATMIDVDSERIRRKPVLGGLINKYTHAA